MTPDVSIAIYSLLQPSIPVPFFELCIALLTSFVPLGILLSILWAVFISAMEHVQTSQAAVVARSPTLPRIFDQRV